MKVCFPPHILFVSPPLTESMKGRIFHRIGSFAERRIGRKYLSDAVGRSTFYPQPIDSPDFRDGSNQLNSKTLYFSFLVEKTPTVDRGKLEQLMNDRAIKGEDGQILYIPDFMSDAAPEFKRFYEVKPGLAHEGNSSGETKVASVHALMQDSGLPYEPGTKWKPNGRLQLFRGLVPLFGPIPIPITITFEYERHNTIQGLLVYSFCIEASLLEAAALALVIAILALIILAVLFPDLLPQIPVPPVPTPELPAPAPNPFPIPPLPIPVPVPVPNLNQAPGMLDSMQRLLFGMSEKPSATSMQRVALRGSVGRNGLNAKDDVQLVQLLLNGFQGIAGSVGLKLDGVAGPLTCGAIMAVQQACGLKAVDGRVDPGGPTLAILGKLGMIAVAAAVRSFPSSEYEATGDNTPVGELDMMTMFWSSLASAKHGPRRS